MPSLLSSEILEKNNFSILHINARSLLSKIGQLEILLSEFDHNFSITVISEKWFGEDTFLNSFKLNDYNLFCDSRPHGGGEGVAVYVHMKLESRVESVQLECSESLIVHTGVAGRDVCSLLAVYRSPSGAAGRFLGDFSVCLSSLPAHSFVVGDLDIDLNPENFLKNSALDYDYFLNKFGFFNVTESPTRF